MNAKNDVLFVDDEAGVRVSWQRYLSDRGLKVLTATDGASAIEQLTRQPVEVVVSDLRMPGIDGLGVLEWLRQRQPNTRFILFTGYGNPQVEQRARQLGAYDCLDKPISPELLADTIVSALESETAPVIDDPPTAPPPAELPLEPASEREPESEPPSAKSVNSEPEVRSNALLDGLAMFGTLAAAGLLGLAYILLLPVIGLASLGWVAARWFTERLWPGPA